jgi:hypothetical protein
MKSDTKKIAWAVGLTAGAATVIGLAAYFTSKKAAAAVAQQQMVEFAPGVSNSFTLAVGSTLVVALPPIHAYHTDSFTGVDTIVGLNVGSADASTGYSYLTLKALQPGKVTVIVDTKGETDPMTIYIQVA